MKARIFILFTLFAALLSFTGCMPTYRDEFLKDCKADNNTEKQCQAAFHYTNRIFFSKEDAKTHGYAVLYNKLTWAEAGKEVDGYVKDFSEVLDYNNAATAQYVETFKLRPALEHKEKVIKLVQSRIHIAELDLKFKQLMGDIESDEALQAMGRYSAKKIFLNKDPRTTFPFTSAQIEGAKSRGVLQPIEHVLYQSSSKYDHKVPDPAHPDDKNQFLWKSSDASLDITNYKIINTEKPDNNLGNYIEGYRVLDGKKESQPALKIFFPTPQVAVVVIDSNREGKDPDSGPDFVEQMAGVISARSVAQNDIILGKLFDEKQEEKRIPPRVGKIFIEVAPVGSSVDVWERSTDPHGYMVPFPYVLGQKLNYSVSLKFKEPEGGHDPGEPMPDYKTIEYVRKAWTGSYGTVWEYYKPKSPYDKPLDAEVAPDADQKHIHFELQDGADVNMLIPPGSNLVIEDKPYAAVYKEGDKWYWLERDPGKSVFNKRKQVSDPALMKSDDDESGHAGMDMGSGSYTRSPKKLNVPENPKP